MLQPAIMRLPSLLICAILFGPIESRACDTALILLMDRSGSMTDEEFSLQTRGTAEALRSQEVVRRIVGSRGTGSIQARVASYDMTVEWHTPWVRVGSQRDANALADAIQGIPRVSYGGTYTGAALQEAIDSFGSLPEDCDRKVIDVSTDGIASDARDLIAARARAEDQEIIINAITVAVVDPGEEDSVFAPQTPQHELIKWARESLITGTGSFALEATFQNYAQAMRTKLSMELAGMPCTTPTRGWRGLPN